MNGEQWWESFVNVRALLVWLQAQGEEPADMHTFVMSPWEWSPEWDEMQAEITQSFAQKDGAP